MLREISSLRGAASTVFSTGPREGDRLFSGASEARTILVEAHSTICLVGRGKSFLAGAAGKKSPSHRLILCLFRSLASEPMACPQRNHQARADSRTDGRFVRQHLRQILRRGWEKVDGRSAGHLEGGRGGPAVVTTELRDHLHAGPRI